MYFLEHSAAAFLIPLNEFAERYDVPIKGNFGAFGAQELLLELARDSTAAVLLKPGYHWLEATELTRFVQSNLQFVRDVNGYQLYFNHPVVKFPAQ